MQGRLYLIGTPLGNLSDFSPRALATIKSLDRLYCEDTRVTAKLVNHFNVKLRLITLSDDSPAGSWAKVIKAVTTGQQVGFASDAGMPGVSDPGRKLVREAWKAGLNPVVIPGPSAVSMLLAACPFVNNLFTFAGFVPRKKSDKARFVKQIAESSQPVFFFESPQRLHAFMTELCEVLEPGREILFGREMTKLHEQFELFTAGKWPDISPRVPALGEFTIAVAATSVHKPAHETSEISSAMQRLLESGFSKRDSVKALAAIWEISPNDVKRLAYNG